MGLFATLLELAIRPTPAGVGVKGGGFKGETVSGFRRRLAGSGVDGAIGFSVSGIVDTSAGLVMSRLEVI